MYIKSVWGEIKSDLRFQSSFNISFCFCEFLSMTFDLSSQCDRQSDKPMSIDSPISPFLLFGSRYEKNGKKNKYGQIISWDFLGET